MTETASKSPARRGKSLKIEFEGLGVDVQYVLPGGFTFKTTNVISIEETSDGKLIFAKTDETFAKVNAGWLSYDIQA